MALNTAESDRNIGSELYSVLQNVLGILFILRIWLSRLNDLQQVGNPAGEHETNKRYERVIRKFVKAGYFKRVASARNFKGGKIFRTLSAGKLCRIIIVKIHLTDSKKSKNLMGGKHCKLFYIC